MNIDDIYNIFKQIRQLIFTSIYLSVIKWYGNDTYEFFFIAELASPKDFQLHTVDNQVFTLKYASLAD
jgi:hypothetical protein